MSKLGRVVSWLGSKLLGKYDSAQTTDENKKHWLQADSDSANAANSPMVRKILRERARHEVQNNPIASGLIGTIGQHLIGTGPRLHPTLPDTIPGHRDIARKIGRAFAQWSRTVGLADKLRIMEEARRVDGESFGLLITNPNNAPRTRVLLDLRVIETEQVTTPFMLLTDPLRVDGIRFDEAGNPVEYTILKQHPGGAAFGAAFFNADAYPAARVLHWFRPRRAGQARGVSELAPSLDLFAQLRRYGKAVLTAAETAAMLAGILESDAEGPVVTPEGFSPTTMDRLELARGTLLTLPPKTRATQFRPEQPTTTFADFKRENLADAGRPVGATLNVITGNSSGYNYSSGRLDHLIYHQGLIVDRDRLRDRVLDPLFIAWLYEASRIPGFLPADLPSIADWTWEWYWDGFASIDPQKDAAASQTMLAIGLTTLAEEYAAFGQDWEEQVTQRVREMALINKLAKETGVDPSSIAEMVRPSASVAPIVQEATHAA